jgi:hypothetical protein
VPPHDEGLVHLPRRRLEVAVDEQTWDKAQTSKKISASFRALGNPNVPKIDAFCYSSNSTDKKSTTNACLSPNLAIESQYVFNKRCQI